MIDPQLFLSGTMESNKGYKEFMEKHHHPCLPRDITREELIEIKETSMWYHDELKMTQNCPWYSRFLSEVDDRRIWAIYKNYGDDFYFRIDGELPYESSLFGIPGLAELMREKKVLLHVFYYPEKYLDSNGEFRYEGQIFKTQEDFDLRLIKIHYELVELGAFSSSGAYYLNRTSPWCNIATCRPKIVEWLDERAEEQFWDEVYGAGGTLRDWFSKYDDNDWDDLSLEN